MAVVCAAAPVMVLALAPVRGSMVSTRPGSPIATWTRPVAGLKKVTSGGPAIGQTLVTLPQVLSISTSAPSSPRRIEAIAPMIDVEAVGAARRQLPVRDIGEI